MLLLILFQIGSYLFFFFGFLFGNLLNYFEVWVFVSLKVLVQVDIIEVIAELCWFNLPQSIFIIKRFFHTFVLRCLKIGALISSKIIFELKINCKVRNLFFLV